MTGVLCDKKKVPFKMKEKFYRTVAWTLLHDRALKKKQKIKIKFSEMRMSRWKRVWGDRVGNN